MFRKKIVIKGILLALIIFCISNPIAFAKTLIPAQTKLSVKIRQSFADFQEGDYVKMYMNSKALKNKEVDWESVNINEASTVFFTGYVSAVDQKKYNLSSGGTVVEYYANIDLEEMVIDDKAYKISGKLYTKTGLKKENLWTNNYDIIFSSDVTDSDLVGEYKEKPDKMQKKNDASNKTSSQVILKNKKEKTKAAKKQNYLKYYYYAAKACTPLIKIGQPASNAIICLANNLQDPVYYTQNGYIEATLPYIYADAYSSMKINSVYQLYGPKGVISLTILPLSTLAYSFTNASINEGLYEYLINGKENK